MITLTITLSEAEQFFYENAGGRVDPPGRIRRAIALADAEERLQSSDASVVWQDDHQEWDADVPQPPHVLRATLVRNQEPLGTLGGIGLYDLDGHYERVTEAELAAEHLL